jgi:thioredoxin reductase (NADPH)
MKKPEAAPKEAAAAAPQTEADNGKLLSEAIRSQLTAVFAKLTRNVGVKLWDDGSQLAGLMKNFMDELKGLSDRIILSYEDASAIGDDVTAPAMELINDDGSSAGIFFHAVPGGHELNSFVIAVYNVGGPGQAVDEEVKNRISAISSPVKIQVLVSLSCTMCPETVMSTQRAATLNRNIRAEMFDLAYFPEMKEKYNVMSVPCTIINGSRVVFGKKNLAEIADILTE